MTTRVCTQCGVEKDVGLFYIENRSKKPRSTCIKCTSSACKRYRENNADVLKEHAKLYRCANKQEISERSKVYRMQNSELLKQKKRERFAANSEVLNARHRAKHQQNKDYDNAKTKEYRDANREKIRVSDRAYYLNPIRQAKTKWYSHNRRQRILNSDASLTVKQWMRIIEMQNNKCSNCGRMFGEHLKPTRDHIIPVSLGGGLTFGNVQALCHSCNCKKSSSVIFTRALNELLVNPC